MHDHLQNQTSVDAKTAEQTLALALRLQQEGGERVSLEELQRTADEAGIDRLSLERALHQVVHQNAQTNLEPQRRRRLITMAISAVMALTISLTMKGGTDHNPFLFFLLVLACFALLAVRISFIRRERGTLRGRFRGWF